MNKQAENKVKELLWDRVYGKLLLRNWFDFFYNYLSSKEMYKIFEALKLYPNVTPEYNNIFAPFDLFGPPHLKMVILTDMPDIDQSDANNGLGMSYRRGLALPTEVNHFISHIRYCEFHGVCSDLYNKKYRYLTRLLDEARNLKSSEEIELDSYSAAEYFKTLQEIDSEREKLDIEWYSPNSSWQYPLEHLASQGVLLMNVIPTLSTGRRDMIQAHRNTWKDFTEMVIHNISDKLDNLIFLSFQERPNEIIKNLVNDEKHLVITYPDPDELTSSKKFFLTSIINEQITATKGVEKVIDFRLIFEENAKTIELF
jgi:uracil DNA glycosylase